MADVQEPTVNDQGWESHPAFGLIGASRMQCGPPGVTLFDSDVKHRQVVRIRISAAERKRELHHDWSMARQQYVEVELSEAQWASFVSSMNAGEGVPCTVKSVGRDSMPELPHSPRLAVTMQATHDAAQEAFGDIQDAMQAYEAALSDKAPAAVRRDALDTLRARINNAVPNVDYTGKRLVEQAEDVTQKARADIEAMVIVKARQLGIDPEELSGGPLELGTGE